MSYKRKRIIKRKPKTYKRKRRRNTQGYQSGMPKVRRAKLRYSENISLTSTAGSTGVYTFRANFPYDPNETGAGHQPMSYDQWGQMYNHYVVVGSKITILQMSGGAAATATISGVYLSDDTTLPYTTPNGFIEAKKGTWRTTTHQRKPTKFSCNFSAKKFFSITDIKDNTGRLGALVSTNPTELAYFNIWFNDVTGATTTNDYQVVVDYIIQFSEPKDQLQS